MEHNETNNPHTINADHPHSKEHQSNPEYHPNLKGNHPKEVDHHGH